MSTQPLKKVRLNERWQLLKVPAYTGKLFLLEGSVWAGPQNTLFRFLTAFGWDTGDGPKPWLFPARVCWMNPRETTMMLQGMPLLFPYPHLIAFKEIPFRSHTYQLELFVSATDMHEE